MRRGIALLTAAGLLLLGACTRTIVVREPTPDRRGGSRPPPNAPPGPEQPDRRNDRGPSTAVTLGVPPGHLPDPGECRVWIPGTPPGRQPRPRSRPCEGIAALAPAGSWILYRPTYDRRLVYVRMVDARRPGIVIHIRVFDIDTEQLVREEEPQPEPRQDERPREERPRDQRPTDDRPPTLIRPEDLRPRRDTQPPTQPPPTQPPPAQRPPDNRPPVQPPPENKPPEQRPPLPPPEIARPLQPPPENKPPEQRPPENRPPDQPAAPSGPATLNVPPGQMPDPGECRLWIPGRAPGLQPRPKSRPCEGLAAAAPAGSWILYRPSQERTVHVRVVDASRAGVVIRVWVYDIDSNRLVREGNP